MNFLERRRCRKEAKALIHHALHLENMRGDLLGVAVVARIKAAAVALSDALKSRDVAVLPDRMAALTTCLENATAKHPLRGGAFRENFEVAVVAVVVAMGLRTYFIQPFKIPTGSMQPTLYGITSEMSESPSLLDRFPFKIVKFAVTGDRYSVRRATADGRLGQALMSPTDPSVVLFQIGGKRHKIPKDALSDGNGYEFGNPRFHPSREVRKGEILWAGVRHSGDHLFVNKVIWNFRKPRRDEVMVFKTDGIPGLVQGTHYIKRMCGLPGEKVSINPPHLVVDNQPVAGFRGIDRVTSAADGYNGYQLAQDLGTVQDSKSLGLDEYYALGDNTRNSADSRFFGTVPARNLVGPAVLVYWPISSRWGLIR